jgi:hypothetical protein
MSSAVTTPGIKRAVFEGRLAHTHGGLTKGQLKENKTGKIVSVKKSSLAKASYNAQGLDGPKGWIRACSLASDELGYRECPIRKGTKFYQLAKKIHREV